MSPDQILDASDVNARADIYSLGVTLYALFAGQAPFQDRKRQQEKLKGHIHDPFPRLIGVRSEVWQSSKRWSRRVRNGVSRQPRMWRSC